MIGSNKERELPAGRIEQQGGMNASGLIVNMSVNLLAHSNSYCVRARGDELGLRFFARCKQAARKPVNAGKDNAESCVSCLYSYMKTASDSSHKT